MTRRFKRLIQGFTTGGVMLAALSLSTRPATADDVSGKVTSSDGYRGLLSRVEKNGKVRVIVKVGTSFSPEAALSKVDVEAQRASISRMQGLLISELETAGRKPSVFHNFKYIPHVAMTIDRETLDALLASPNVVSVQEDIPVPVVLDKSVPRIGAKKLQSKGVTGKGVAVAVLDTGVDKNHPFLQGSVVSEACYSTTAAGYGSSSVCPGGVASSTAADSALPYGGNCPSGECDHGTHVSGIVAGRSGVSGSPGPGVAPEASIIAIQVFSRFDSTYYCGSSPCALSFTSDQIDGLERVYALKDTYNIASVNMSLGGGSYSSNCDGDSRKDIIDNLKAAGIATVISSGNSYYCGSMGAPACISSAVSVGATDDKDAVANYSNSASFTSLLAPGSAINSSIPLASGGGYQSWDGTSMAAPHVAGAWALMKQGLPNATVDQVLAALAGSGRAVKDKKCGSVTKNRINVSDAYKPPTIKVSPRSVNLGTVRNGELSSSKTLTISNAAKSGGFSLNVGAMNITGTDAADFSVQNNCASPLANAGSCAAAVAIEPSTFGKKSATLTIPSDDPKNPAVSVKLAATVAPSVISVSPSSLNFGKVQTGVASSPKTVTIKNTGLSDLKFNSFSKSDDSFNITENKCVAPLIKNASCTISLTFSPTSVGAKSGTLNISSNAQKKPLVSVKLIGTATSP